MKDYFSPQKQGGQINSLIANQDSLAIVYAVEQIYNKDIFDFGINISNFSIQCETDDDLCIVNTENKIYIQLKTANITKKQFFEIMDRFLENYNSQSGSQGRESFFVIATFSEFKIDGKNIVQNVRSYRKILADPNENDTKKNATKKELIELFKLQKYNCIIDKFYIDNRPLFRDDKDVKAIFSRYLRLAYGVKDHKQSIIDAIYEELISKFEQARRERGFVTKETIEGIIGKMLAKDTIFDKFKLLIKYEKVENGYKKIETEKNQILEIEEGCKKAAKNIFREWRHVYRKEFWMSLLVGAKKCPECGHPMIANINGLWGISCPDCGYSPYVSFFSTCNCGHYELIKTQPELDESKIFKYLNEFYTEDRKCSKCGRILSDEYFEFRSIMLPVPYPLEKYKDIDEIYKNSKY